MIKPFKRAAKEAIQLLGLTPVENYVTFAEDADSLIVRAWVDPGKTFAKVYIDAEVAYMAADPDSYTAVVSLLRNELYRATLSNLLLVPE